MSMKRWTIDGFHEDNRQPFTIHAEGHQVCDAIANGFRDHEGNPETMVIVSVFPGHVKDRSGFDEAITAADYLKDKS